MGMWGSRSSCQCGRSSAPLAPIELQPNPTKWRIAKTLRGSGGDDAAVAVMVLYEGCTNYEGKKILVYDNFNKFHKLRKGGRLDPHFCENHYGPLARFKPTENGWKLATALVEALSS